MIFERRQYTLRPGRVDDFWAAQRRWNVHEASAALMDASLSYFSTVAETTDQIVYLPGGIEPFRAGDGSPAVATPGAGR